MRMLVPSDIEVLREIEEFLIKEGLSPSKFGLEAMADPALVFQLRAGDRSLTLRSMRRVADYINSRKASKLATLPPTGSAGAHD